MLISGHFRLLAIDPIALRATEIAMPLESLQLHYSSPMRLQYWLDASIFIAAPHRMRLRTTGSYCSAILATQPELCIWIWVLPDARDNGLILVPMPYPMASRARFRSSIRFARGNVNRRHGTATRARPPSFNLGNAVCMHCFTRLLSTRGPLSEYRLWFPL